MGLLTHQLKQKRILFEANTIGGGTYLVDEIPLCLANQRANGKEGHYCTKAAGYATDHPGTGRCKYHGGASLAPNMGNGRYSPVARGRLAEQYSQFSQDPDVLDLVPELILLRSLLATTLELYQEVLPDDRYGMKLTTTLVDKIAQHVERIERISANHTLTVMNAKYIMLRALDVAKGFIEPEELPSFIEAWRQEVLNPVSVKLMGDVKIDEQAR